MFASDLWWLSGYKPWRCTEIRFESKGAVNYSLFITSILPNYHFVQPVPAEFTLSVSKHNRLSPAWKLHELLWPEQCSTNAAASWAQLNWTQEISSDKHLRTCQLSLSCADDSSVSCLPPSTHRNAPRPSVTPLAPTHGNLGVYDLKAKITLPPLSRKLFYQCGKSAFSPV